MARRENRESIRVAMMAMDAGGDRRVCSVQAQTVKTAFVNKPPVSSALSSSSPPIDRSACETGRSVRLIDLFA